MVTSTLALAWLLQGGRFQSVATLPALPPVILDSSIEYKGPAKKICEKYNLEGRILWIDATANIERYNTEEKIVALVDRIRRAGFNTIVFDVKPLSSEMVYPSKFAPKLKEWRGKELGDFDPLGPMSREARKNQLKLYVSMNAFCDGHRLVSRGPGFERPDEQSMVYESAPVLRIGDQTFMVSSRPEDGKVMVGGVPASEATIINFNRKLQVIDSALPMPKGGFKVSATGEVGTRLSTVGLVGAQANFESDNRFVPLLESSDKQMPLMTSPTNPSVRRRLLDIAKEVTTGYDIDGIIYDDRLRYTGINGDFTPLTRSLFEQHVKQRLNWPQDVFEFTYGYNNGLVRRIRPGKFYDAWLAWRAGVLKRFVQDVRATVRQIKPKSQVGVYAGSWYGDYQTYGNNWAAPAMEAGFWFMTPEYRKTGFAPEIDFLVTGCYYPTATMYDAMVEGRGLGTTVEGAGNLSYRAVHDETFVYAGLSLMDFKENPEGLANALQAAVSTTNGVMVFDLSHDIEPMWSVFEKAFSKPKRAPHSTEGYLVEARRLRFGMDKKGIKEPPIIVNNGAPGVGF